MSLDASLKREVADQQVKMFALFVGRGLRFTRAALEAATGIPDSSLREYAKGAAIPLHVVLTLARVMPAEAINMLTEPAGKRLVTADTTSTSWDAIACGAAGLVGEVCDARRDGTIDHVEDAQLKRRTRALIAELQHAVEDG